VQENTGKSGKFTFPAHVILRILQTACAMLVLQTCISRADAEHTHTASPFWEHSKGKPLPVSLRATTLPKGEGIAFPSEEGGTVIAVTEEAVFLKEGGKGAQQFCNCPTN